MSGKKKTKNKKKPGKSFNCDQCDKEFALECKLKTHFNQVHIGARPFECPECGQAFKQIGHLNGHVKYVHADDEATLLDECDGCGKMVKRIQSHMQMHDEEKQHKCPVCSKLSEQNTIYHGTKIFIALRRQTLEQMQVVHPLN